MRFFFFLLFFSAVVVNAQQTANIIFGAPSAEELTMTSYGSKDGASAVVLYDYTRVRFEFDENITESRFVFEKTVRIKILSQAGLEYGNLELPFLTVENLEQIKTFKGITTNSGNNKIEQFPVDIKDVFTVKNTKNVATFKVAFNNVKVGSVIDYNYTIDRDAVFLIPQVMLQRDIPVAKADVVFDFPDVLGVMQDFIGLEKIVANTEIKDNQIMRGNSGKVSYSRISRLYSYEGILPIAEEPYMFGTIADQVKTIKSRAISFKFPGENPIMLNGSNSAMIKAFVKSKYLWGQTQKKINAIEIVEAAKKLSSKKEQLLFIVNYVRENIKWDQNHSLGTLDVGDVLKEKKGTDGAINLLTMNLLNQTGILSLPLLGTDRENRVMNKADVDFSIFRKTYTTAQIEDTTFIFDAANKHADIGIIPFEILGSSAMYVTSQNASWVDLWSDAGKKQQTVFLNVTLDSKGELNGEITFKNSSYLRDNSITAFTKDSLAYIKAKKENLPKALPISNFEVLGNSADNKQFVEKASVKFNLPKTGGYHIFSPASLFPFQGNPFTSKTRNFDIDFEAALAYKLVAKITTTGDLKLAEPLLEKGLQNDDGSFIIKRTFSTNENELYLIIDLETNKAVFPKTEYEMIQALFESLKEWVNEPIIFSQK